MSDQHKLDLNDLLYTKTQAKDLLSDLLGIAPTLSLFDEPLPKKAVKAASRWIPRSLVIVSVTHTCTCGEVHVHTSPKVLLKEDFVDYQDQILYSEETSNPKSLRSGELPADFTVEYQTVSGEPLPFCLSCVASCNSADLKRIFFMQDSININPENGLRRVVEDLSTASDSLSLSDLI